MKSVDKLKKKIYVMFRYLDRLLLIPVPKRERKVTDPEKWNASFQQLLKATSSVIGEVIQLGQWTGSAEGIMFRKSCKAIVLESCGSHIKEESRLVKMWACGLLVARKVLYNKSVYQKQ